MINNLDIKCVGYLKAFNDYKMYQFRLKIVNKEYLVADISFNEKYDSVETINTTLWTDKNEFENYEFSKGLKELLFETILLVPKVEIELTDESLPLCFKQNIIETKPIKEKYVKEIGIYNCEEVNNLMRVITDYDIPNGVINDKTIKFARKEFGYNLLDELLGYDVDYDFDGDHRNDGQFVDYDFIITSPTGVVTTFSTEMCLMVGWNYGGDLKINEK